MAIIQFPKPNAPGSAYRLNTADFPDASTLAGQTAISGAVATLNPSPVFVQISVETTDDVTVDGVGYPYTQAVLFTSLSSWYASL